MTAELETRRIRTAYSVGPRIMAVDEDGRTWKMKYEWDAWSPIPQSEALARIIERGTITVHRWEMLS